MNTDEKRRHRCSTGLQPVRLAEQAISLFYLSTLTPTALGMAREQIRRLPSPCYLGGARRFSSSNQLVTTINWVRAALVSGD